MRVAVVVAGLLGLSGSSVALSSSSEETTRFQGVVREAITRKPIAGAVISAGGSDAAVTDSAGRFALVVLRRTTWIGVRHPGHLDFQYPLLQLSTDTLNAYVELRTNPPAPESYIAGRFLPMLCVMFEPPRSMTVTHKCPPLAPEYFVRRYKHNPWSPYFGEAGDWGGVEIRWR